MVNSIFYRIKTKVYKLSNIRARSNAFRTLISGPNSAPCLYSLSLPLISAPCLCPRSLPYSLPLFSATFCISKSIPTPFYFRPIRLSSSPEKVATATGTRRITWRQNDRQGKAWLEIGLNLINQRAGELGERDAPAASSRLADDSVIKGAIRLHSAPAQPLRRRVTDAGVKKGAKSGSLAPAQPLRQRVTDAGIKKAKSGSLAPAQPL